MSTPTNVTIDNQLEYTYKEITLDTSANIVDSELKFGVGNYIIQRAT